MTFPMTGSFVKLVLRSRSVVSFFNLDQWEFSVEIRRSSLQVKESSFSNGVSVNEIKKGLQPAFWGHRFSTTLLKLVVYSFQVLRGLRVGS